MKPGYSLWIKNDNNEKVFGLGPYNLLLLVEELGSLNKAAKDMGLSYSKAIGIINRAEKELNIKLLHREVGGTHGGGSTLTDEAREIIQKYIEFREDAIVAIEKSFNEIFIAKR